jgi:hypothetical protein
MKVHCTVDEITLDGDYGEVPSVCATCSRCDHCEETFGTSEASVARCLVMLRENCPNAEHNFYYDAEGA